MARLGINLTWPKTWARRAMLVAIFFGVIVLLGHLHYTIDVLSAFFITYSIFHLALYFFQEDWRLFNEGLKEEKFLDIKV